MRYQSKLLIVGITTLALSLFAAGMVYLGVERSKDYFERSRSAHGQLEAYLTLSAHTYELFKQWSDAMLIGETALETARANLSRQIEADINLLRHSVRVEASKLHGERKQEELAELERIAEIRQQLLTILYNFGQVEALVVDGKQAAAREKLSKLLQESIDTRFRFLIDQAISDEISEVIAVDEKTAQTHAAFILAAQFYVVIVSIVILAGIYFLLKRLRQPLQELLAGTGALSRGDLAYRIQISGHDEFAELGRSFNDMATDLDSKQRSLQKIQSSLEEEVENRTEELQAANEALERVDAVRRRFFADISHELRTPLTVIRGEGQITLRGQDKLVPDYKAALHRIVDQAKHLGNLVDDLLFIAREDVGELRLKRDEILLLPVLQTVCADGRVLAGEKNVELACSLPSNQLLYSGDEGRLRQLFLILLDNAICYSNENDHIDVIAKYEGDVLTVTVADTGIGIAEDELDVVFERFGRGANAQTHHAAGIGLGLPLAKSIVEAHGGTISVESKVSQGTKVTVSFSPVKKMEMVS